jgi:hypothetical protein
MYVAFEVCMHACMYVRMNVCMYACGHREYIQSMYVCMYACMHVYMLYVCMWTS